MDEEWRELKEGKEGKEKVELMKLYFNLSTCQEKELNT